jgi:hypothetical protein
LATPEADPEKIIRKGKALHEGTSTVEPGISDDFHYPIGTPISSFQPSVIPSVGVSRTLNFGSVPVEFSPPGLGLEGESLVTPLSPEIIPWFRPNASEYFPTLGFTTPPPIRVTDFHYHREGNLCSLKPSSLFSKSSVVSLSSQKLSSSLPCSNTFSS